MLFPPPFQVYKVGVNYDSSTRTIGDWIIREG